MTLGNLVISNSAVLTLAGSPGTRVTLDELQVLAGAGLIVSGAAIITAANVTVEAGASLSADGLGYGASSGPGAGDDGMGLGNQAGGGGHGGRGGAGWEGGFYAVYLPLVMRGLDEVGKLSSWSGSGDPDRAKSGDGGQPYGDAAEPGLMGSGGGSAGAAPGGAGGGALRLVVDDTLILNGDLTANGLAGSSSLHKGISSDSHVVSLRPELRPRGLVERHAGGGGAGGSLWLEVGAFSGSGALSANGGDGGDTGPGNENGQGGGGAGGRVAVYAQDNAFTATGGTISVAGGGGLEDGEAGTVYVSTTTSPVTVTADFAAAPLGGSAPLTVTFTNLSSNATGYQWSFGDGSTLLTTGEITSVLASRTHVYTRAGSFSVVLTATASGASDVEIKSDYISVTTTGPLTVTADFAATPLGGDAPLTVTFSNLSSSSEQIDGYAWDFGDGSTLLTTGGAASELINPTHVYTQAGSFTVALTVTAGSESASVVKVDYISVTASLPATVTADFVASPGSGSAPLAVIFRNRSTSSDEPGYFWDFGDGSTLLTTDGSVENPVHVYTRTGGFTATLTAIAGSASDVKSGYISVTALSLASVRAPEVSIVAPAEGGVVGAGEIGVSGVVSDDGALVGVWVNGVTATLVGEGLERGLAEWADLGGEGLERGLAEWADGADGADLVFSATVSLGSGNQVVNVVAQDDAGALGFASRVLRVDGDGPQIEVHAPRDGQAVYSLTPTVSISYTDFYTQVNPASLRVLLTDENDAARDVTGDFTATLQGAQGVLSAPLLTDTVYTLSVGLADALGNASAVTTTLYAPPDPAGVVPPPEPAGAGWVSGVVYAAGTCNVHLTTCTGLRGARVRLSLAGELSATLTGTVVTGPGGFFAFPVPETGHYWLRAEKAGYTYAQREVEVVRERSTATDEIFLTQLDAALTSCDEGGCSHVNSGGSIRLEIPAGAIPAGETVGASATWFEQVEFLPSGGLPAGTWETYAFNLGGDSEFVFLQPITVSVSNTLGFAPGTPIPLGYWNQATLEWEHAGTGVVEAGGAWVVLTVTHFSNYDCNDPVPPPYFTPPPPPAPPPPPPPCPDGEEGCFILYNSGELREWVDLPPVSVLGRSVSPQLRYSTRRANPSAVIDLQLDLEESPGDIEGGYVGWELYIEGEKTDSFTFAADLSHGGELGRYRYYWDGRNALGERLPPGVYDYKVRFTLPYTAQYCYSLDGVFGNPPDCENGATGEYVEAVEEVWAFGTVLLAGELDSPWGAGWLLGGQERLYESEKGRILVMDGQSEVEFYFPYKDRTRPGSGQESLLAWVNADGDSLQTLPEGLARNWQEASVDVGNGPTSVAVSQDGAYAYVVNSGDNTLSVVDLRGTRPQVVGSIETGSSPRDVALSPDGTQAFVTIDSSTGAGSVALVDLATLAVTGSVAVGSDPHYIVLAPGGDLAYVTHNIENSVSVVDLQALAMTDSIIVGTHPAGIALSPGGEYAYIANRGDDTLSVLERSAELTSSLATLTTTAIITVENGPEDVAVSPDGEYAYVTNSSADSVSVVDLATLAVLTDTISVGNLPQSIVLSGEWAVVVNAGSNNVSLLNLRTGQQVTIGVGVSPQDVALSPDGEYAFVTNANDDTMSALNLAIRGRMSSVDVGLEPQGVAISPDGEYAYVTSGPGLEMGYVSVVDLATQQQVAAVELGSAARPWGVTLSPSGTLAYVANYGARSLTVVERSAELTSSLVSLTVTGTVINVGRRPRNVAVSPDGEYAYVTSDILLPPEAGEVAVVSLTTTQKLTAIAVGNNPYDIALSPGGEYAYVTNSYDDSMSVLDLRALTETATIPVGDDPRGIALSPDGEWAYVVNYADDNVAVLDLELGQVVYTIDVGNGPEDIVLSLDGEYAYVTNAYQDDHISVLDLRARRQVRSIGVGDKPLGIALWGVPPLEAAARTVTDRSTLSYDPWREAYVRTFPDGRRVYFNPDGTHDYTLEPDGRRIAYAYHADGALASMSVTAPGEAAPRWVWGFGSGEVGSGELGSREVGSGKVGSGWVVEVSDPAGRTTSLTVDENGHLAQVVLPDGAGRSFFYDERGLLTQQVDGEGYVSEYVYDDYGRIREQVGPQHTVYDAQSGESRAERERRAFTPSDTAYPLINDSLVGDPDEPAPAVFSSTLLLDGVRRGRGGDSGHTNEWGNWLDRTDALGRTTAFERDGANRLTKLTQPNGDCVEIAYDEAGNPVSTARMGAVQCVLPPDERDDDQVRVTATTYEPRFNKIKTSVDPLGRVTTYYYDYELGLGEAGNLIRVEYPMVRDENGVLVTPVISYTYNAWGQLETTTNERGTVMRYVYTQGTPDEAHGGVNPLFAPGVTPTLGLRTQVIQDDGGLSLTTTYKDFNAMGNAMTVINPGDQNVTRYLYDVLGRVISHTSPLGVVTLSEYDGNGHLVRQVVDASGDEVVIEYEYDAEGQLISRRTTAGGQTLQTGQVYDVNGELAARQDARGNQTLSVYDEADQLVQTIDPAGQVVSYTYDLNGRLESTTNAAGAVARTEYDDYGRLVRSISNWNDGVFDPSEPDKDIETRYQYDAAGNTIIVTDTLGRMTRTFYDNGGRTLGSIVNWDGDVTLAECAALPPIRDENLCTLYAYDLAGRTIVVTDTSSTGSEQGVGRMTRTFYDALGRVQATVSNWNPATLSSPQDCILSPMNESVENVCTLYGYDAAGNQITTTNALNQTSLTVYDGINRPIINVANWDGNIMIDDATDCAFPPARPDTNLCTVTEYDARGRRSATQDPLGNLTEYGYDGQGRLITTTRYLGGEPVVTVNHYDALGNRVGQSDALGHTTAYIYDDLDRLAATVSAEGVVTVRGYDEFGRVVTTTNNLGHQTFSGYDILGRMVAVTDAENNVTRYAYDALGKRVAITDANGVRTSYLYDGLNRLSAVTENDTGGAPTHDSNVLTQYVYDALGNRIVITNALGYTSTHTVYDALNRPVVVKDASGHETTTRYNALGYRTVITDANSAVTRYSYDGLNRLIGVQYVDDGVMVRYSYDALGNRTAMTDTLGVTRYEYDDLYRLVSVSDLLTGTVDYGYDLVGNRTHLTYPDSKVVTYTYDADSRLTYVEDWNNGLTSYDYDAAGQLISTTLPNGVMTVYRYDGANRLLNLTHTATDDTLLSSYSYELDGVGNRVRAVEVLTETTHTITYAYDGLYRLTEADYSGSENFQYTYNATGNMIAMTATLTNTVVTTKAYDAANRLITVTTNGAVRTLEWNDNGELLRDGGLSTGPGQANTYQWNAAGLLVSATVNGVASRYAYLGDGGRISMTVGSETTTYTLDLAAPLVQVLVAHESASQRVSEYLYGVARIGEYDGDWHYHLADYLGSVRLLVGADGSFEGTQAYQPYGLPLSSARSASSIYGFTGEQADPTGLIYLRARYYSPGLLQFTRQDAWSGDDYFPLTLHKFLYSLGNPVNYYDPSGMFPVPPGWRPPPCVTDCGMFVAQIQYAIKAIRDARECDAFLRSSTREDDLIIDFLANYYSGIPFIWHGFYLPVPQESTFRPGDPDRWQVPIWDQQETPQLSWDHPINRPDSELGQAMRRSYGFKRPYFEQTHHYFAFLKFAYYWGGPPVERWHKQQEIDRQLIPTMKEWQKHTGEPNYAEWYAWVYRESVYDLFIVDEAVNLARAVDIIGVDAIPSVLATWCAINEADVWSLESKVDQFYFDFPHEYWPDKQYWPRR